MPDPHVQRAPMSNIRALLRHPHFAKWASVLLVGVCSVIWLGTTLCTADARLAALQTVEPYTFATHEQLLFNFLRYGHFFQTVHVGYTDEWTWSGHRAFTLPVVAWIYGLHPSPFWLWRIQIVAVLLGVIPAMVIGRRALGSAWGLALGGSIYLATPTVMIMALQDYQDMVFALPFLMCTFACMMHRRAWVVVVGAVVAVLAREECVPLLLLIAIVVLPQKDPETLRRPWSLWVRNVLIAFVIAGLYTCFHLAFPVGQGGRNVPAGTLWSLMGEGEVGIPMEGFLYLQDFYPLMMVPLGWFAWLSPLTLLPGLGVLFAHMTMPSDFGVNRNWAGHVHHLAPAVTFLVVASIQGTATLLRVGDRLRSRRAGRWFVGLMGIALATFTLIQTGAWAREHKVILALLPRAPTWTHPVWELAAQLPADATPIASRSVVVALSSRSVAYTYDGSLGEREPRLGLGAGTHLIADTRDRALMVRVQGMPGATTVAQAEPFVLITWPEGAIDPSASTWAAWNLRKTLKWVGPYRSIRDVPGLPPHIARKRMPQDGSLPVLQLPWAR